MKKDQKTIKKHQKTIKKDQLQTLDIKKFNDLKFFFKNENEDKKIKNLNDSLKIDLLKLISLDDIYYFDASNDYRVIYSGKLKKK
jgi:hypothetical protein